MLHKKDFETFIQSLNYTAFDRMQATLSVLFLSTTAWVVLFRQRLSFLSVGFRTALNVLLDVDNYMRERPLDANPRARICARYVSLLRHLCRRQSPDDGRNVYDAIVIVAHSQGTVITADLLRLLRTQRTAATIAAGPSPGGPAGAGQSLDPALKGLGDEIPLYFFTMGCPLRQLYALRFPHLYRWAQHDLTDHWRPESPALIPRAEKPSPDELDVTLWVNTFRSGDYVGRYLWRSPRCSYQWESPEGPWDIPMPQNVSQDAGHLEDARRREFCLGSRCAYALLGQDSPVVAAELDRIIDLACRRKSWRAGGIVQRLPTESAITTGAEIAM